MTGEIIKNIDIDLSIQGFSMNFAVDPSASWSPDGNLISLYPCGIIEVRQLTDNTNCVNTERIFPGGDFPWGSSGYEIAVAYPQGVIEIWNVLKESRDRIIDFELDEETSTISLDWSSDDKFMAIGTDCEPILFDFDKDVTLKLQIPESLKICDD